MTDEEMFNAPKTRALMRMLKLSRVDVRPGTAFHAALMDFGHIEATKTSELVAEYQRANPITIEVKTSEEARRVIEMVRSTEHEEIARLRRALEGVKDWALRSEASGLAQWCSEALNPTGKLSAFPPTESKEQELRELLRKKDAQIDVLADRLEAHGSRGNMGDPKWHSFHCIENGHDAECDADRAALHLVGRLP